MKILINASTLVVGGGVQVALNFIRHTYTNKKHQYYYVLSKQVYEQLTEEELLQIKYYVAKISPAKYFKGKPIRTKVLEIEKQFQPDVVYSIGAPSYIKFLTPEVLRLTNPMIIGGTKLSFSTYSIKKKIIELLSLYTKRLFIRKSQHIITQTKAAKLDIVKNLKIPEKQVFIISNVYASIFDEKLNIEKDKNTINILTFSAAYLHKNLDILPEVAYHLKNKEIYNFKFTVTIPENFNLQLYQKFRNLCEKYQVQEYIQNIGKVNFKDAPQLYQTSDILFLPTLLEIFSVTYLEAMASNVPIVTTDLPFSKEVCEDAALYYEPKNALQAANKICELIENKVKREELIEFGKERLSTFSKADEIYEKHIETLEKVYNKEVRNKA